MRLFMAVTIASTLPAIFLRLLHIEGDPRVDSIIFGIGIFGAAFLLSWAAEVAQMDISRGLALAILALIAILPEYAVDLYFAWVAAYEPAYSAYATANMTGANRLLVGGGWFFVVLLYCLKHRQKGVQLETTNRVEISYLTIATLYAFTIPLKGSLNVLDFLLLASLFACYAWRTAVMEVHEPELVGPARLIAQLPKEKRQVVNVALFLFAAFAIFCCAEPFAEALIGSGRLLNIDEYFLVQWLAPLASESPEFIIAAIWSLRGQAPAAMGALISSTVNQWTLLIGTIPVVYSISGGAINSMILDGRQQDEILLTASQSIFAIVVLMNLHISLWEAGALFSLFAAQLVYPDIRIQVAVLYILMASILIFRRTKDVLPLLREGLLNRKV
jgi:cation:H+ antiporter